MSSHQSSRAGSANAVQVVMPQMGESLTEGTIVRWLKQPGDRVLRDEPLFELTTDKVDTDVPSPAEGVLTSILVAEGQTVAIGEPVGIIETADAAAPQAEAQGVPAPAAVAVEAAAPAATPPTTADEPGGHFKSSHAPQLVSFRRDRSAVSPSAPPAPSHVAPAARPAGVGPANGSLSPAVLEEVRKGGVPLDRLGAMQGSGRGGRITKRDVQRWVESGGVVAASRASGAAASPRADDGPPSEFLYRPAAGDRLEPMSTVRKRIARHMQWSVRISPHATAQGEVDMTAVTALLADRDAFREANGAPLTYTVFAAAATIRALRDFPILNSSIVGDDIAFKPAINLGIAVALPESDELIVPVVRRAEDLALAGLARAMHDLVVRARARQLRPEDVQGGTFTLTNPGVFGGITGTPILNQPQVGILGLGAVRKTAVVIDDALGIRSMMALALTFDHRATDGMVAFRFLARVREILETPPSDWHWTR